MLRYRIEVMALAADDVVANLGGVLFDRRCLGWDTMVMLDDRNERPGAMFADWELIGVPHRVTIGDRALKEGQLEYQHRRDTESTRIAADGAFEFLKAKLGL